MEYYTVEKKNNLGEQYIELSVFHIVIDYGLNVGKVVSEIQNEVVNAIDRYIGFRNVKVNVNVNKIKF